MMGKVYLLLSIEFVAAMGMCVFTGGRAGLADVGHVEVNQLEFVSWHWHWHCHQGKHTHWTPC
jgi:hypothetical protein